VKWHEQEIVAVVFVLLLFSGFLLCFWLHRRANLKIAAQRKKNASKSTPSALTATEEAAAQASAV
jgi:hypothetical protein